MLERLMRRLRLFFVGHGHAELDEEMAFHLEQETAANVAKGMVLHEARRRAAVAFGGLEKSRERTYEQRPGYWAETLLQDMRYAVRGLRRNRIFTATVILTFMLGIGATTAVFSVVDRILFRPLPYGHGDRLVSVGMVAPIEPQEFMLGGSYFEWRDHQAPFRALTSETGVNPCDVTEEKPERLNCAGVEESFLPTLEVNLVAGRNFTPEEDAPNGPKVAILSYGLWRSRFNGDLSAVGKIMMLDGRSVEIVGVLPESFEMPRLQRADILVPQALDVEAQRRADPGRPMWAFGRLKPGVSVEQAKAQLEPLFDYSLRLAPAAFRKEVHLRVRSVRDRQVEDVRLIAWVLLGLVLAVLLIACANVTSLLMARGASREREMAVRSALGASRRRLVRQAMTEACVLALAGAVAGFVMAEGMLRLFVAMAPNGMPFLSEARIDGRILVFALLSGALCAAISGIAPALQRPRAEALGSRSMRTGAQALQRRVLVVAQIAASMVLLVSGGMLMRSFANLQGQELGLQVHNVVTASITLGHKAYPTAADQMAFFERLERDLRYGPGVTGLALSDSLPPGGYHRDQVYASLGVEGRPRTVSGTGGNVAWRWVTPDYFRTLEIPIVAGRAFSEDDQTSTGRFVVLSKLLAARLFPGVDPVGQRMHVAVGAADAQNPLYTVVGVAADVKNGGLAGGDEPEYYRLRRSQQEDWDQSAVVVVGTSLPAEGMENWIRGRVAGLDPTVPVKLQTLSERVSEMADQPRFETMLVGFFALMGLILTVVGLYGVVSFGVVQREKEFGVRIALGATRRDILALVMGGGLRLIVVGMAIGVALAMVGSRMLESLLYRTNARDPMVFAGVALLLMAVAMAATLVPALAATEVQPAEALRGD